MILLKVALSILVCLKIGVFYKSLRVFGCRALNNYNLTERCTKLFMLLFSLILFLFYLLRGKTGSSLSYTQLLIISFRWQSIFTSRLLAIIKQYGNFYFSAFVLIMFVLFLGRYLINILPNYLHSLTLVKRTLAIIMLSLAQMI